MESTQAGTPADPSRIGQASIWWVTLSGFCAILVGIGLARFAYSPLIPALIEAGWFSPGQTAYLGAANLAGYLVGALMAGRIAWHTGTSAALGLMMALAAASFFACAVPLDFWWYSGWRLAAGIAGGALMVLGPTAALARVPPERHGFVGGVIFTAVGVGIVLSGTLVPPLLRIGLPETWLALGGISVLLGLLALPGWWKLPPVARPAARPVAPNGAMASPKTPRLPRDRVLLATIVVYALCAVGLVPHMVFLVDFVARGLGRGITEGALIWVLFGAGAVCGPMTIGHLADRIGFGRALRLGLLVQVAAVGLIAVATDFAALALSSLLVGAFLPSSVALVLGRVRALLAGDPARQQATWGLATTAFAVGQAAAAYGFALLIDRGGAGATLFVVGAAALAVALVIDITAGRASPRQPNSGSEDQ